MRLLPSIARYGRFVSTCLFLLLRGDPSSGFSISKWQASSVPVTRATRDANCEEALSSPMTQTQACREISHSIASQFSTTEFNPLPSLTNCHIQTISGVYLRTVEDYKYITASSGVELAQVSATTLLSAFWKKNDERSSSSTKLSLNPDQEGFYDERQRFETPDGDFFDVDFKYRDMLSREPSYKGMVIVLHGLQSNSQSSLSVDMATAYINQGFDVACMNFRGCSGEMNRKMGGYHLGFTEDLKQFLRHLKVEREAKITHSDDSSLSASFPPLFLSGFSLGSNVVLKCLGELGETAHRDYNIYGAAVCGAPFDQERNINFVQAPGFNRLVYMNFLLKSLKDRSLQQMELFQNSEEWKKVDSEKVANAETIADIENAVLAPIYGFQDNIDYYRQNSCLQFLNDIVVPTFIVNAADDPFFDPDPDAFPWDKSSDYDETSPIRMVRTAHGGHLGFMFHQAADTSAKESLADGELEERASWMPSELSRFLNCAFENRAKLDKVSSNLSHTENTLILQ